MAENTPFSKPTLTTLDAVPGNHIIEDLGEGRFALYAHLQPGSLRAKPGQRVRRGDVLARLGNTGNSDAPHLHFHVDDAPSALGAEGVPYAFEAYRLLGKGDGETMMTGQAWRADPAAPPTNQRAMLPAEDEIVAPPP